MSNLCNYRLCLIPKHSYHAFCRTHWRKLPLTLQEAIQRRWHAYKHSRRPMARAAALAAWRRSMAEAVAFLDGNSPQPPQPSNPETANP